METMLVLLVMTVMMSLAVKTAVPYRQNSDVTKIMEDIIMTQIRAIREDEYADYDNDEQDIHVTFTRRGSVLMADCFTVNGQDIIVALGTGRVYVRP